MGCSSCSGGGCGTKPNGCQGNGGCSTGGCNRLNVFDWLSDMEIPTSFEEFDIVEIRFKGGRKDFYRNTNGLELITGDAVVVEVPNGHHIGHVSLKGELVRLQMLKRKVENNEEIRSIYRVATEKDLEKYYSVRDLESGTMYRSREIIQELGLRMKLSDVEYQADKSKATFYYSADDRVDFRDLIKKLAEEFKVRIEMRQISLRHEAGRLGGIGSCGRELCCSTWLTDFKSVSTTAARYQNLSLNPSKLSGQCGRLKCCLNYELDTYMEALKDIPTVSRPLQTQKGDAILQKTDIFRKIMWFGVKDDNNWHPVPVERVQEIIELNAQGIVPETLVVVQEVVAKPETMVTQLEGNLERLDSKYKSKSKKKKKKKGRQPASDTGEGAQQRPAQQQKQPDAAKPKADRKPFKKNRNKPRPEGEAPAGPAAARPEQGEGQQRRKRRPNRPNPNRNKPTEQTQKNNSNA
ncbi:MAG: Signal peptidase-like protein [Hymenobacteraceae bacterium]|nr:Signal peptidase-like protein [Hymenobacteraceae bacterium]MDX5397066.1 Signal peptidase-like protein [Hymenobacteraceae bacterium]MDX5442889.1 Signal peptidase-like protein [Hymenobacteraceae bacterium]MDX5513136.1 Signal peptidase-like protein [Hymenobacteraceae bacterium]